MGRDEHFDETWLFDASFLLIVSYFVFARLMYAVSVWGESSFIEGIALFTRPGLVHWAGIVGATLTSIVYARFRGWKVWKVMDFFVVTLSVILIFGHIGALLNGSNPGVQVKYLGLSYPGVDESLFSIDLLGLVWYFLVFILVSRVRKNFRFYQWYKADKGAARDGLSALVFANLTGWYYFVRSFLDDNLLSVWEWPAMRSIGIGLIIMSFVFIYIFSGRKISEDVSFISRFVKSDRSRSAVVNLKRRRKKGGLA